MSNPISPDQIRQAKEWAEDVTRPVHMWSIVPTARAAVEVIQSLPDHIIDADKVQEVLDAITYRATKAATPEERSEAKYIRGLFHDLLPAPRTLADMFADEVSALVGQSVKFPGDRIGQLLAFDETWCAILVDKANTASGWPEVMRARRDLVTPVEQAASEPEGVNGPFPAPGDRRGHGGHR